jgi:protein-tyrosine phosphatase
LDARLVHVVASDGHDCERRPPVMDAARDWLQKHYGDAVAEALCVTNPAAALSGESMRVPESREESSVPKWYRFWR